MTREGDFVPLEEELTCRGPPNHKASSPQQLNCAMGLYWPGSSRANCKVIRELAVCSVPRANHEDFGK